MKAPTLKPAWSGLLFDLDGTLVDTAPDLAYALNLLRQSRGMQQLPESALRAHASSGARGLLAAGFGMVPDDIDYASMRDEFLIEYEKNLTRNSRLFPGMAELLDTIEARKIPWGIVTNKATRFTVPLLKVLNLWKRAGCVICGDTTPHAKPHPAPLLAAARKIRASPATCLYVGDDLRDVQASRAAGMVVAVARYGYLGGSPPDSWNADLMIDSPTDLIPVLSAGIAR
ncbi:MAG: HAD-IA family hydrolase [Burkholderiales bacterium]